MIFHVCSHWGDIEVEAHDDGSLIKYFKLTPLEREALDATMATYGLSRSGEKGEIIVPHPVVEVGAEIGKHLHGESGKLTAIKFSNGEVAVSREPVVPWYRRLMSRMAGVAQDAKDTVTTMVPVPGPMPAPAGGAPVAAVQVPTPKKGCPMPTMTELREQKAAGVVRKFLVGQQVEDFNHRRAFLAVGSDSGHVYRVTSRWSRDVEKYGVLYNVDRQLRVCSQNKHLPPSEEVLSMMFAVQHMEQEFLNAPHGRHW